MDEKDKTSGEVNTGHGAIAAFAGFQYQYFYFILKLLEMSRRGEVVGFEYHDDVDAVCGGELTYFQLKHTICASRNMTLCDLDLWKSIYVWLDIIKKEKDNGNSTVENSEFYLISNKLYSSNKFCNDVKDFQKGSKNIKDIRDTIKSIKSKSKDKNLLKYLHEIESSDELENLLKHVSFVCLSEENLFNEIKFKIRNLGICEENCNDAVNSFIGEVATKWFLPIQSGEKPQISIDDVIPIKQVVVEKYSRCPKFIGKRNCDIKKFCGNLTDQLFIKQLLFVHDIEAEDKDDIINYTQRFIDYTQSISSMAETHAILNEDLVNLKKDAYQYWKQQFKYRYRNVDGGDENQICDRACDLLNDIRNHDLIFAGKESIESYFSNGLFYSLSNDCDDEYAIGWHFRWKEIFRKK